MMNLIVPETLAYETLEGMKLDAGPHGEPPEGAQVQIVQFPCRLRVAHHLPDGEEFGMDLGWPEDLVLALASVPRWKFWLKRYRLSEAILLGAHACERCMNALAHRYGLRWGYPEHSDEWRRAGTTCKFCS